MTIYFITANKGKFNEAKSIIPKIKQIDLDLPEIQELAPKKIIREKLSEATGKHEGKFFCEDTSLYLNCMNGFPGPLIKWLLKSLGNDGIFNLVSKYKDKTAVAKTIIGYTDGKKIRFFSGKLEGTVVKPKGKKGFGWDGIFQPKGFNKTLAEMSKKEKNKISMRKQALIKLKNYINS